MARPPAGNRREAHGTRRTGVDLRPARRRRTIVLVIAVAAVLIGGGATAVLLLTRPSATAADVAAPRALSETEAERLAVTRFRNYQHGGVSFDATIPDQGRVLALDGFLDFRQHLGYAVLQQDQAAPGVIQWNLARLVSWPGAAVEKVPPAALPASRGVVRPLTEHSSALDTILAVALNLAADRPENAQLLRQSDARWLRSDTVNGVPVDVFGGPSGGSAAGTAPTTGSASDSAPAGKVRYWIDADGTLHRLEVDVPGGTAVITMRTSGFVAFTAAPELGTS